MDLPRIKQEVLDHISKSSEPKSPNTPLEVYLTPLADYLTPLSEYTKPLIDVPPPVPDYARPNGNDPPSRSSSKEKAPESDPHIARNDHRAYLLYALALARQSPPKSTNFRVGAFLLDADSNTILSSGYTLELDGNTHAEQVCFMKLALKHKVPEDKIGTILPENTIMYTTMEPCNMRQSQNLPCVDRILEVGAKIKIVYVGVSEPETFVWENEGKRRLVAAGIRVVHLKGLERTILEVATTGHHRRKPIEGKATG